MSTQPSESNSFSLDSVSSTTDISNLLKNDSNLLYKSITEIFYSNLNKYSLILKEKNIIFQNILKQILEKEKKIKENLNQIENMKNRPKKSYKLMDKYRKINNILKNIFDGNFYINNYYNNNNFNYGNEKYLFLNNKRKSPIYDLELFINKNKKKNKEKNSTIEISESSHNSNKSNNNNNEVNNFEINNKLNNNLNTNQISTNITNNSPNNIIENNNINNYIKINKNNYNTDSPIKLSSEEEEDEEETLNHKITNNTNNNEIIIPKYNNVSYKETSNNNNNNNNKPYRFRKIFNFKHYTNNNSNNNNNVNSKELSNNIQNILNIISYNDIEQYYINNFWDLYDKPIISKIILFNNGTKSIQKLIDQFYSKGYTNFKNIELIINFNNDNYYKNEYEKIINILMNDKDNLYYYYYLQKYFNNNDENIIIKKKYETNQKNEKNEEKKNNEENNNNNNIEEKNNKDKNGQINYHIKNNNVINKIEMKIILKENYNKFEIIVLNILDEFKNMIKNVEILFYTNKIDLFSKIEINNNNINCITNLNEDFYSNIKIAYDSIKKFKNIINNNNDNNLLL